MTSCLKTLLITGILLAINGRGERSNNQAFSNLNVTELTFHQALPVQDKEQSSNSTHKNDENHSASRNGDIKMTNDEGTIDAAHDVDDNDDDKEDLEAISNEREDLNAHSNVNESISYFRSTTHIKTLVKLVSSPSRHIFTWNDDAQKWLRRTQTNCSRTVVSGPEASSAVDTLLSLFNTEDFIQETLISFFDQVEDSKGLHALSEPMQIGNNCSYIFLAVGSYSHCETQCSDDEENLSVTAQAMVNTFATNLIQITSNKSKTNDPLQLEKLLMTSQLMKLAAHSFNSSLNLETKNQTAHLQLPDMIFVAENFPNSTIASTQPLKDNVEPPQLNIRIKIIPSVFGNLSRIQNYSVVSRRESAQDGHELEDVIRHLVNANKMQKQRTGSDLVNDIDILFRAHNDGVFQSKNPKSGHATSFLRKYAENKRGSLVKNDKLVELSILEDRLAHIRNEVEFLSPYLFVNDKEKLKHHEILLRFQSDTRNEHLHIHLGRVFQSCSDLWTDKHFPMTTSLLETRFNDCYEDRLDELHKATNEFQAIKSKFWDDLSERNQVRFKEDILKRHTLTVEKFQRRLNRLTLPRFTKDLEEDLSDIREKALNYFDRGFVDFNYNPPSLLEQARLNLTREIATTATKMSLLNQDILKTQCRDVVREAKEQVISTMNLQFMPCDYSTLELFLQVVETQLETRSFLNSSFIKFQHDDTCNESFTVMIKDAEKSLRAKIEQVDNSLFHVQYGPHLHIAAERLRNATKPYPEPLRYWLAWVFAGLQPALVLPKHGWHLRSRFVQELRRHDSRYTSDVLNEYWKDMQVLLLENYISGPSLSILLWIIAVVVLIRLLIRLLIFIRRKIDILFFGAHDNANNHVVHGHHVPPQNQPVRDFSFVYEFILYNREVVEERIRRGRLFLQNTI